MAEEDQIYYLPEKSLRQNKVHDITEVKKRANKIIANDGDGESMLKATDKIPSSEFDLDLKIQKLKLALNDWREILLPVKSVLLWEKQWHPGAIIGSCTIVFTLLWLMEPNLLTTLSVLALTMTLSDYFVPLLANSMFKSELWTMGKEKEYEDICRSLVVYKEKFLIATGSFYLMRTTKPKLYYSITIVTLLLLAWIGNSFNNLFLTYLFVTSMLLLPGMECHGVLNKYGIIFTKKLNNFTVKSAVSKKEH